MSNNWCNRQPMKKSIVRNVDVKRQPKPAEQVVKIPDNSTIKLPKVYHKDTQDYSVPQKNTLIDMRKKLDDFNEYKNAESEFLQKTKEKIAQMQGFNNKEVNDLRVSFFTEIS